MPIFVEKYKLPKLIQEESENLKRPITTNEIEAVIKTKQNKNLPANKRTGPDGLPKQFYQTFKELTTIPLTPFQQLQEYTTLPSSFYKASIILIPKPDKDMAKKKNYRP